MFTITLVGEKPFNIEETDVVRIQKAIPGIMQPGSSTRIDAKSTFDVLDDPESVAETVRTVTGKKLAALTVPNGNTVWFSGPASQGPLWLPDGEITGKTKSALLIGNKRMFVRNTPEDVAKVIGEAGGYVLPIRSEWKDIEILGTVQSAADIQDWPDQDLDGGAPFE